MRRSTRVSGTYVGVFCFVLLCFCLHMLLYTKYLRLRMPYVLLYGKVSSPNASRMTRGGSVFAGGGGSSRVSALLMSVGFTYDRRCNLLGDLFFFFLPSAVCRTSRTVTGINSTPPPAGPRQIGNTSQSRR